MIAKRSLFAVAMLLAASSAWAYQVTGPVLEVTDSKIVVQKGKEKWELARTPETKVTGDLKVGSKVTVEYSMTAKSIEVKGEKAGAKKK
ncbi:MAG TPA: hypothetical protein VEG36_00775 [Burkholderiales bacterium]|nr:hypothetical protein [Burkholderiales bacterium]